MEQETIRRYHLLGNKTLFMFIIKKSGWFFVLLAGLIVGAAFLNYVPSRYLDLAIKTIVGCSIALLVFFVLIIFVGFIEYLRYWIFVDDKDIKIARGFISTEQVGIPYRRIKDIKIQRSLLDQLFGVSDIIITNLGSDRDEKTDEDDIVILPSLDETIAMEIQDIVLRKAQVEQVHVLSNQKF